MHFFAKENSDIFSESEFPQLCSVVACAKERNDRNETHMRRLTTHVPGNLGKFNIDRHLIHCPTKSHDENKIITLD